MNEIELIRAQLVAERTHAARVTRACIGALGAAQPAEANAIRLFRDTCVSYLVWVLTRFEQRDQLLAELLKGLAPGCGEGTAAVELAGIAARPGTSREALSKLEAALDASTPEAVRSAWEAFAHFFESAWSARRIAIEEHLSRLPGILHWRAVCAVDADSILEERTRYAQVAGQLPRGLTLEAPPD